MDQNFWRRCIVCKSEIGFSTKYYKCSVDACDKKRAPAQFCTVSCWDVHRSIMNHKSAGADEYTSASKQQFLSTNNERPTVRIVGSPKPKIETSSSDIPQDILVVVSKLKAYVKAKSGLNTSSDVMDVLSDIIRDHCDKAIQSAHRDNRKTLMGRDF